MYIYNFVVCFFFIFLPLVLELWKEERGRRTLENENIRRLQNKKETGKRTKQKPKKKDVDGECSNESRVMLMLSFLAVVSFLQR